MQSTREPWSVLHLSTGALILYDSIFQTLFDSLLLQWLHLPLNAPPTPTLNFGPVLVHSRGGGVEPAENPYPQQQHRGKTLISQGARGAPALREPAGDSGPPAAALRGQGPEVSLCVRPFPHPYLG